MNPTSVIKARLGIEPNGRVQKFFTNTCRIHNDKYVPKGDTKKLSSNVKTNADSYVYKTPYAHYMYKGILYVDPDTGSSYARKDVTKVPTGKLLHYRNGGSYWDRKMVSAEMNDIVKEVQNYINGGK